MDFHKLKLNAYGSIGVAYAPDGIELPFTPAKSKYECLLAFVQSEAQVDESINSVVNSGSGTCLILAYPKGSSKRYTSAVNRDLIAAKIKQAGGFKAPLLVSLNEDWSGFSFRYVGSDT